MVMNPGPRMHHPVSNRLNDTRLRPSNRIQHHADRASSSICTFNGSLFRGLLSLRDSKPRPRRPDSTHLSIQKKVRLAALSIRCEE